MTDRYAVFGNPLGHTKSPQIHLAFARQTGEQIDYVAIEAPRDGFADAMAQFIAGGGKGANITVPFKLEALEMATRICPNAKHAGATNCLKFQENLIIAENFDGVGLLADIERNHGFGVAGKSVLVVGAGGAARGALQPLLDASPSRLVVANRTVGKARALAASFDDERLAPLGHDKIGGESFDLIVNATSASLYGELPPVPPSVFHRDSFAYEMVYGKGMTPFLALARDSGATRLADGIGMLVEQAAEAFFWWRGVRPETGPLISSLSLPLN